MRKSILLVISIIVIFSTVFTAFGSEIPVSEKGEVIIEDFSKIEILSEDVLASDDVIGSYLELMLTDIADAYGGNEYKMDDQFISDYSLMYFGIQLNTVDEAKNYIRETLEANNYKNAVIKALKGIGTVVSYPGDLYEMVTEYVENEIAYYAYQNGIDGNEFANIEGYESEDALLEVERQNYLTTAMIIDQILEKNGITVTEEEIDAALEAYMKEQGFDSYLSLEDYKETAGETWMWLFTEFRCKQELIFELLKDSIVIV